MTMSFFAKFPIQGVRKIYEHSLENPVFMPNFAQRFQGEYRVDGKDTEMKGLSTPVLEEVDLKKIPPQFWMIVDEGCCLMAATQKELPRVDGGKGSFVVYCEGLNPEVDDDCYERKRNVFGGDDFNQVLPLDWFQRAIENADRTGIDMMIVKVTESSFQLMADWE
jgi:hypothetical protein